MQHPAPQERPAERLLTTDQLAARWQISPKTLRNWRVSGKGPLAILIGGCVRYSISAVEAFEAAQASASTIWRGGDDPAQTA